MERLLERFIKLVLVEKKSDTLKKKYPDLTAEIDELENAVPVGYIEWCVKQIQSGSKLNDVIPTVKYFDKHKQRFKERDINRYTAKSLEDEVKNISSQKSKNKQKEEIKTTGAEKLYEDGNNILLFIKNKEASICYGAGTKWCIAMSDATYWEEYTEKNVVFYFDIDKSLPVSDPLHKYGIAVIRGRENQILGIEIYDAEDNLVGEEHLSSKTKNIINTDAPSRPMNFDYALRNNLLDHEQLIDIIKNAEDGDLDDGYNKKILAAKQLFGRRFEEHWEENPEELFSLIGFLKEGKNEEFVRRILDVLPERLLRSFLDNANPEIRRSIAAYSDSIDTVLALRHDDNEKVRKEVVGALSSRWNGYYVDEMVNDPSPAVRGVIASHLEWLNNPEKFRVLIDDPDPTVQKMARFAFRRIERDKNNKDD